MKHTFQKLSNTCSWLCLLLVCCLSSHAQQDKQPFEFVGVPDPFVLTAQAEHKIQVWNNTTKPLSLKVALIDEPADATERLSSVIVLETSVINIAPAAAAAIVLRGKPEATLKPGSTLTAQLVVSDDASGVVKRKSLKLTEAKRPTPALTSAVSSFKAKAYYNPLSSSTYEAKVVEVPLPLTANLGVNEVDNHFNNSKDLALLTEKNDGQTALAQYVRAQTGLPGGTSGIMFGLKTGGTSGEYTGNLSTIKTEDGKPVTLNIVATHVWWLPALTCFIGILIYYLMQWYLNVLRKVWELQERETLLGVTFNQASQNFARTVANQASKNESIANDFSSQRASLLEMIKALRFKNFIKLDENSDAYKNVDKQLNELDQVARSWSEFGEKSLNPLDRALNNAQGSFGQHPRDETLEQTKPEIAMKAKDSLTPLGSMSVGKFKERAARINELLPRLSAWPVLNTKVSLIWQKLDEIVNAPDFPQRNLLRQQEIKTDRDEAFTLWRTLWTSDSFEPANLAGDLSELANSLALYVGESRKVDKPLAAIASARIGSRDETPPLEQLRSMVWKRIAWDVFYLFLVTAVAIYTGLKTFYFDQPFGGGRDYLDALVWGFGTKALIDLVTGAINKFWPTAIA